MYLRKFGFRVSLAAPDRHGVISPDEIEKHITPETLLVSVMHANNEVGAVNDVKSISDLCRKHGVFFHSDTVQSVGKTTVKPKELGLDFMTMSAHKFYGPKGIGILFKDENVRIDKYMHGGGQERDMRGGTENAASIAGLRKAVEILRDSMEDDIKHYRKLNRIIRNGLVSTFGKNVEFNSGENNSVPNIINVTFNHLKLNVPEGLLPVQLDLKGISVSGGSACSSGSLKPSKVLLEIGLDERAAQSSIRISVGRYNTEEEAAKLIAELKEVISA